MKVKVEPKVNLSFGSDIKITEEQLKLLSKLPTSFPKLEINADEIREYFKNVTTTTL